MVSNSLFLSFCSGLVEVLQPTERKDNSKRKQCPLKCQLVLVGA